MEMQAVTPMFKEPESMMDFALAYAAAGIPVFRLCWPGEDGKCGCGWGHHDPRDVGKAPRTGGGLKAATQDAAQIRRWWTETPKANIGGATDGLLVVDIDPAKGGRDAWAELMKAHGELNPSPETITGTDGRHIWTKLPKGVVVKNSVSKIAEGIDTRTAGGYVVLPPSLHANGQTYEWNLMGSIFSTPMIETPRWLLEKAAAGTNGQHPNDPLDSSKILAGIPEGQRDDTLFRWACKLRSLDIPADMAKELLVKAADAAVPPFPRDKAIQKVVNAYKNYPAGTTKEREQAGTPPREQPTPPTSAEEDPFAGGFTAESLMTKEIPERVWAVPGFLPEGFMLLGGRPKFGKSWLSLGLCVAVATGGMALSKWPANKGRVLYLALEDNELRLKERLGIVLQNQRPPENLHIFNRWPKLNEGCLKRLVGWMERYPDTRLIVIDTLARIQGDKGGKAGMSYHSDYLDSGQVQRLALAYHVCVVVVTHIGKEDREDYLAMISGTTGITGAADGAMVLKRQRGQADAYLQGTHRDIKDEFDYALRWDRDIGVWSVVGDAEEYRLSMEKQKIITTLRRAGEPMGPLEVSEAGNLNHGSLRVMMPEMYRDSLLTQPVSGKYGLPEWEVRGRGH